MSAEKPSRRPRYVQVADDLIRAIRDGAYPVGTLLPTAAELCREYHTSRQTVRRALRRLAEQGLIRRRKGRGTLVRSRQPLVRYNQYVGSLYDLLQYGAETRFEILRSAHIRVDENLAALLDCRPGDGCLHLHGIRYERAIARPVCTTEVYRCAREDAVAERLRDLKTAVFVLLEELSIERVGRVEQTLTAVNIGELEAHELGVEANAAGLRTTRRYFDQNDELLLAAVSLHPGAVFSYSTVLEREVAY